MSINKERCKVVCDSSMYRGKGQYSRPWNALEGERGAQCRN